MKTRHAPFDIMADSEEYRYCSPHDSRVEDASAPRSKQPFQRIVLDVKKGDELGPSKLGSDGTKPT